MQSKASIAQKLENDYQHPAPPLNQSYIKQVLNQMDYADDPTHALLSSSWLRVPTDSAIKQRRDEARDRLARNLAHSESDQYGRLVTYRHGCQLGCHPSREAAVEDIQEDLDLVQMGRKVPVPAINRWLRLF